LGKSIVYGRLVLNMLGIYYTPCNVGIYIGGYKVSDAFRVDWDAKDSKTPLYGWADDTFSAVTNGRKIITGRLVINYRYPGYLASAISVFNTQKGSGRLPKDKAEKQQELKEFISLSSTERIKFLAKVSAKDYGDNELGELARVSPRGQFKTSLGEMPDGLEAYKQKRSFDIFITYGDIEKEDHIETTIKDAYIVGQSQVISASATGGGDVSSSGSPIYEIYSFFAKEIVEGLRRTRHNKPSGTSVGSTT